MFFVWFPPFYCLQRVPPPPPLLSALIGQSSSSSLFVSFSFLETNLFASNGISFHAGKDSSKIIVYLPMKRKYSVSGKKGSTRASATVPSHNKDGNRFLAPCTFLSILLPNALRCNSPRIPQKTRRAVLLSEKQFAGIILSLSLSLKTLIRRLCLHESERARGSGLCHSKAGLYFGLKQVRGWLEEGTCFPGKVLSMKSWKPIL